MLDETKSVAAVYPRCPVCQNRPKLWRLSNGIDRKPTFQVRCDSILCNGRYVPAEPIEDSQGAVRAWALSVKLQEL